MKKILIMLAIALAAVAAFARGCPGGGGGCRPGPGPGGWCRPCPPPHPGPGPGWGCGGDWWGRGGRNFWPGFIAGAATSIIANNCIGGAVAVPTTTVVTQPTYVQPTVVTTPVVTQPTYVTPAATVNPVVVTPTVTGRVWVEGRYENQVQANGVMVRVWIPGHWM